MASPLRLIYSILFQIRHLQDRINQNLKCERLFNDNANEFSRVNGLKIEDWVV